MAESTKKYADMSEEDLKNRLVETEQELMAARLNHRIGQFKKTSDFKRLRREIARIKTFINKKQVKAA